MASGPVLLIYRARNNRPGLAQSGRGENVDCGLLKGSPPLYRRSALSYSGRSVRTDIRLTLVRPLLVRIRFSRSRGFL